MTVFLRWGSLNRVLEKLKLINGPGWLRLATYADSNTLHALLLNSADGAGAAADGKDD